MKLKDDERYILKAQVEKQLKEVEQLREEKVRLKAENKELRRRLGLNRENSDKAPSSDGYKKKPLEVGIPKEGVKKSGGHRGKTLERL